MLKMCAAFFVMYVSLYFCGYSLRVLLLNDDLKKFDLCVTPWLGIGVIVTVFFPLSWMGYSVQAVINYFIAVVASANIAAWLKFRERPRVERREAALMAITALAVAAVYSGALAKGGGDALAVAKNSDFGSYLNCVNYVLTSGARGMSESAQGAPLTPIIFYSLNLQLRGCIFVVAFFGALFRLEPIDVMYGVSAFVMFLNAVTFRLFLRGRGGLAAMIPALLIFPLNVFFQDFVFFAFTGQLFSFGLVTMAFYLEYYLSERAKFDPRTCAALIFVITVNALCWIEGMAFPLLPAAALALVLIFGGGYDKKSCALNAVFVASLFAAVNFRLIILFVRVIFFVDTSAQAWAMDMPTFVDIAGLRDIFGAGGALRFALLLIVNVLLSYCLLRRIKKEGAMSLISVSFLIFLITHLVFCARYFKPGDAQSYNAFKSALSLSFIVCVLMARAAEDCFADANRRGKSETSAQRAGYILPPLLFAVCLALNIFNTGKNLTAMGKNWEYVVTNGSKLVGLYADNPRYESSDFILNCDYSLHLFVAEYFCPRGRVYAASYAGRALNPRGLMKDSIKDGDIYIASARTERSLVSARAQLAASNEIYNIYRLDENSIVLSGIDGLSHDLLSYSIRGESFDGRLLFGDSAALEYMTARETAGDFVFKYFDAASGPEFSVVVYLNGNRLGEFESVDRILEISLEDARLERGRNVFTFDFGGGRSSIYLMGVRYE